MLCMCSIQLQPVVQRLVSFLPFLLVCICFSHTLYAVLIYWLGISISLETLQTIDTILSLHQDSVPVRFGIIMYSSRLINVIEENDGSKSDEDTSTLVIMFSVFHYCDLLGALCLDV